jgi:cellulose synthase/poly-beta-1,6-N-acetylglucosamine synthase-like glycosyltransferase
MISFVVPAHNEQACLGKTLAAIHEAVRAFGGPYEIVVVDDASTDSTAEIARGHDAIVVPVNHRQIAATRNSGARAAKGARLFFVDADTTIHARVVQAAMRAMDRGAAGGGALAKFNDDVPLYAPLLLLWMNVFMRIAGMTGGAFMFCTREAFQASGGFNERLYGAEDAAMCWALKREGPFVVLWRRVGTSGRRTRGMSGVRMIAALFRMAFSPRMLKQRSTVHKVWYESDRAAEEATAESWTVCASNFVLFLLMLAVITGPLWMFVPWSLTPWDSALGKVRYAIAILGCHIGLVLLPCAYFLFRILLQQKRWFERIKVTAFIALCLWFGWGGAREVFWFWKWVISGIF